MLTIHFICYLKQAMFTADVIMLLWLSHINNIFHMLPQTGYVYSWFYYATVIKPCCKESQQILLHTAVCFGATWLEGVFFQGFISADLIFVLPVLSSLFYWLVIFFFIDFVVYFHKFLAGNCFFIFKKCSDFIKWFSIIFKYCVINYYLKQN